MGHTPSRHAAAPLLPVAPTVRLGSSARLRAKLQESCPLPSAVRRAINRYNADMHRYVTICKIYRVKLLLQLPKRV